MRLHPFIRLILTTNPRGAHAMTSHTKEPWELTKECISIQAYPPGDVVRICLAPDHMFRGPDSPRWQANAARIVACVNACAGIPTENLGEVIEGGMLAFEAKQWAEEMRP